MTDKHTITIPEAALEALIDLRNSAGRVIEVESLRRRAATLGQADKRQAREADLYDQLTRLQAEHEYAVRITAALWRSSDIIDAEIADDDLPF